MMPLNLLARYAIILSAGTYAVGGLAFAQAQPEILVSGTVTGPDGARIKDAKVMLSGLETRTDSRGNYAFKSTTALYGTGSEAWGQAARQAGRLPEPNRFPWPAGEAAGTFLADAAGRRTRAVPELPGADGPARLSDAQAKSTAVPETLSVIAVGFARGERVVASPAGTQDFRLSALKYTNIVFRTGAISATEREVCILDVHAPKTGTRWPVVIHLHGGGLTGGDRNEAFTGNNRFGQKFLDAGVMHVAPGYRLIRHGGTFPDYIRDAAQAAIWVRKNIECYGGDPHSVFISGFSAGAYLTHMLSVDSTWFAEAKYDPRHFAGFISLSGQTRVHDSLQMDLKVADIMAEKPWAVPMGNIRKTSLPWQIFVGSREGHTVTDNQALYEACLKAGSTDLYFDNIEGLGHEVGDMGNTVSIKRDKFLAFIAKYKGRGL